MKVLTVDDAKTVRSMVRNILEPAGYDVTEAENGLDALDVLNGQDVDVILLDWEMPKMDGLTFLQEVRGKELAPDTKIIMLSSLNKIENVMRAIDAGADEYIMKPFTPEMILERIKETVGL